MTLDRTAALGHIQAALADIAPDVDLAEIDSSQPLREEADIDSMDFLRLVSALAVRTGVEIPESDYPQVATLDGLVAYLMR